MTRPPHHNSVVPSNPAPARPGIVVSVVSLIMGAVVTLTVIGGALAVAGRAWLMPPHIVGISAVVSVAGGLGILLVHCRSRRAIETLRDRLSESLDTQDRLGRDLDDARAAARDVAGTATPDALASISHEIRTPMSAILGYADLMLQPGLDDATRCRYAATMKRNGKHLLAMINDILDLSKLDAGRMRLERVACSPGEVIADVAALMRLGAEQKGLTLEVEYTTAIPSTIRTDPTRLRQILLNLVDNAVKFTERGGLRISARCDGPRTEDPTVSVTVTDTGIGLTATQQGRLFRPFTQAETSIVRRFGGTGLGLSISKRFAEMLGGDITVSSTPGRGSAFTVTVATGPLDDVDMVVSAAVDRAAARVDHRRSAAGV